MKKLLLALALSVAAAAPAAAQAPVLSPYYDYFGKNKIVYDTLQLEDLPLDALRHLLLRPRRGLAPEGRLVRRERLRRHLAGAQLPDPEADQHHLLRDALRVRADQHAARTSSRRASAPSPCPRATAWSCPSTCPTRSSQKLIAHELTHVFQFEIFFGGNFIRAYTSGAPQWLTEGMASYFGNDEDEKDVMVLRDAVLNDQVPEIAERAIYGFFAYRFGHAVFDFMRAEWGTDGVRDFVFEYRGSLGPNIDRVLKRTFGISAEEFDIRFRRYLRQRFIKLLTETGEPIDFGDRVRLTEEGSSVEVSVRAFPSGDLGAAISSLDNDANVVVLSTRDRKLFKNLTKGFKTEYEYIVAQWLTTGPVGGVDLAVVARRQHDRGLRQARARPRADAPERARRRDPASSSRCRASTSS